MSVRHHKDMVFGVAPGEVCVEIVREDGIGQPRVLHERTMTEEQLARYDKLNSQIHHDESARRMAELALDAAYTETQDL